VEPFTYASLTLIVLTLIGPPKDMDGRRTALWRHRLEVR
jgi:hypothetical protein